MSKLYAGASIGVGAPLSMEELDLGGSISEAHDKLNLVVGSLHSAVRLSTEAEHTRTVMGPEQRKTRQEVTVNTDAYPLLLTIFERSKCSNYTESDFQDLLMTFVGQFNNGLMDTEHPDLLSMIQGHQLSASSNVCDAVAMLQGYLHSGSLGGSGTQGPRNMMDAEQRRVRVIQDCHADQKTLLVRLRAKSVSSVYITQLELQLSQCDDGWTASTM